MRVPISYDAPPSDKRLEVMERFGFSRSSVSQDGKVYWIAVPSNTHLTVNKREDAIQHTYNLKWDGAIVVTITHVLGTTPAIRLFVHTPVAASTAAPAPAAAGGAGASSSEDFSEHLKASLDTALNILDRGGIEKGYLRDLEAMLERIKRLQALNNHKYEEIIASNEAYKALRARFPDWKITAKQRADLDAQEESIEDTFNDPVTRALMAARGTTTPDQIAKVRKYVTLLADWRRNTSMSAEERIRLAASLMRLDREVTAKAPAAGKR